MVAIETRYLGPTNTRGSRIVATDANGGRVVVSCASNLGSEDNHKVAALALLKKRGWGGLWIMGGTRTGRVFVQGAWGPGAEAPARILEPHEVAEVRPR